MGMRDEIQSELAQAFDAEDELADAVTTFTCDRRVLVDSDPINGNVYNTVSYQGRGVFGSYNQQEILTLGVLVTDKKVLVLQNEVSQSPIIGDEWQTSNGKFKVMHIGQDPTSSIWVCQMRRV